MSCNYARLKCHGVYLREKMWQYQRFLKHAFEVAQGDAVETQPVPHRCRLNRPAPCDGNAPLVAYFCLSSRFLSFFSEILTLNSEILTFFLRSSDFKLRNSDFFLRNSDFNLSTCGLGMLMHDKIIKMSTNSNQIQITQLILFWMFNRFPSKVFS